MLYSQLAGLIDLRKLRNISVSLRKNLKNFVVKNMNLKIQEPREKLCSVTKIKNNCSSEV